LKFKATAFGVLLFTSTAAGIKQRRYGNDDFLLGKKLYFTSTLILHDK
jgi:hypothetical protein